ncbi:MAG: Asp-tRNA(Asn)/Glu-tRNA(Gln) amidotransferase subunit GatC [Eubacteriales bacterium]|nr:Asp-tRNA(Asn)/Glu-tRNA(Gln) amidotransferase subunit GatC [Eubacteriales bacterium]
MDIKEVEATARLAKIELNEKDKERIADDLQRMIDYVKQLQQIDTDGVEPTSHVVALQNVLREDVPAESLPRESFLPQAPDASDEGFVIPSVIE